MTMWRLIAWIVARPAVARWLVARAMRTPDEHLPGYMERFWLFNQYDGVKVSHREYLS